MGLRGPKAKGQEDWMLPVAELMTTEHMSFSAACQALGTKFDNSAAERAAQYCEPFRDVLNALGFKYHALTGDNPLLTKGYLTGILVDAMRRLMEQDQPDKVAVPGKLLADLMGWLEQAPDAPVIANLTQSEIDELRTKVEAEKQKQAQPVQVVIVDGGGKVN
jgi:hypothetical protein